MGVGSGAAGAAWAAPIICKKRKERKEKKRGKGKGGEEEIGENMGRGNRSI